MSDGPALHLDRISAGYQAVPALSEVAWTAEEGSCWGLLGPNGAGKTTLLRVLGGVLRARSGAISLFGKDTATLSRPAWSRLTAFVPAALDIPVALTVRELVAMGRLPYLSGWQRFSEGDRLAVRQALEWTGLTGYEERYLDELSGGERQRASIAMALAQQPRLLLLDEPTAHLDIHHAWQIMELIVRLKVARRMTIVFSSHDLNLCVEFASHLLLLKKGRVMRQGVRREVLDEGLLSEVYEYPLRLETPEGEKGSCWIRPARGAEGVSAAEGKA